MNTNELVNYFLKALWLRNQHYHYLSAFKKWVLPKFVRFKLRDLGFLDLI